MSGPPFADCTKEIPGGKVDEPDESLLHAAVRELKEESGLEATRIVRQVTDMTFTIPRLKGQIDRWMKLIYEMEARRLHFLNFVAVLTKHCRSRN